MTQIEIRWSYQHHWHQLTISDLKVILTLYLFLKYVIKLNQIRQLEHSILPR